VQVNDPCRNVHHNEGGWGGSRLDDLFAPRWAPATRSFPFVSFFIRIPCQIIETGRKVVYRLLAWNAWQGVFYRMAAQLCRPLRC
jgi:hypothetical protein